MQYTFLHNVDDFVIINEVFAYQTLPLLEIVNDFLESLSLGTAVLRPLRKMACVRPLIKNTRPPGIKSAILSV